MPRLLGIAVAQMAPIPWDQSATLEKMESLIQQISLSIPWVNMICFPELCAHGIMQFIAPPDVKWSMGQVAEPIPGPISDRFCQLARQIKKWVMPGSIYERAGDAIYNTAFVISPQGEIVARYRKLFPWRPHEQTTPGQDFCVFDIPDVGRLGLCICYDMWFPEVSRTLAWLGAEVILHPSLTYTSDRQVEIVLSQANAIFNQAYFIDINASGPYGGGHSSIVDPNGRVLQQATQPEIILTEILDLDQVTRTRELGTLGLCQTWKEIRDFNGSFPLYTQGHKNSPMLQALSPLKYQTNLTSE